MYILDNDTVIDDRFRIVGEIGMSGQSMGYKAEDLAAPIGEKWRRNIFFKQYHDILENHLGLFDLFFQNLGRKVGEDTGRICLPVDRDINNKDISRYEPACGIAGRGVYAAYPFVSNITLQEKLDKGLKEEERKRIAIALIETLRRLALKEVAHLDLKPSNIMIQERKNIIYIRLIDLDMARIVGQRGIRDIGGTEGYMSPEHYLSCYGAVSCASDIFTLGILLSQILFGQYPFCDADNYREAAKLGQYEIPVTDYHPDIVSAIIRCLSPNPIDRPKIGEINFYFTKYYGIELKKTRAYVVISNGNTRHYFESLCFGYQEMRGMGISNLTNNNVFRLEINPDNSEYSITLIDPKVQAAVDGRPMRDKRPVNLSKKCCLTVNGKPLQVELVPY